MGAFAHPARYDCARPLETALNDLSALGWEPGLHDALASLNDPSLTPARVAVVERGRYALIGLGEPVWATLAGRLLHEAADPLDTPAVGDWVAVRIGQGSAVIASLLPRRSLFVRKAVGSGGAPQAVAANIDRVLVVTAAGGDLSPRRIERYLAAVWDGGAEPVVVVNKTDLVTDWGALTRTVATAAQGAPVAYVSAHEERGLAELSPWIEARSTLALVGSSGVGKSTLTNRLLGHAAQTTQEVRAADHKGRHTTTRRELFITPGGAILIDTPGMRELGLYQADAGVAATFSEIETLAQGCRFRDCSHSGEPGCAVEAAVGQGELDPQRLSSFNKLQRELEFEARRGDPVAMSNAKERWKTIHKAMKSRSRILTQAGHKKP